MNTLATILSSNTRAEFFRLLFGLNQKEYYLREIEKHSGLTIRTIQQEAYKLEKLNLILKRKDGNRIYYSANKNHPLFNDIHQMVLKTSGLVDILESSLVDNEIQYAFVFGSISSGNEKSDSDVDLFIIGDLGLRSLSKLLKKPAGIIGREINPHIMTSEEFTQRKLNNDHFIINILTNSKLFIKGDENEFNRLGEK